MWWLGARTTTLPIITLHETLMHCSRPKRCSWSVLRTIQMWTLAELCWVGSRAFVRTCPKCLTYITIWERTESPKKTTTVDRCASKTKTVVTFMEGTLGAIAVELSTTFNCSSKGLARESSSIRISMGRQALYCKLLTSTRDRRQCRKDKQRSHQRTTGFKASTKIKQQMSLNA